MKKALILTACVILFVIVGAVVWLRAATPTVGETSVAPSFIAVNTPTQVRITAQITDPTLLPAGVNLLRVDASGKTLAVLGQMYDDGTHGDLVAGDKTFSLMVPSNEISIGQLYFQASAAFKGLLKRITSTVVAVTVWPVVRSPNANYALAVPPQATSAHSTDTLNGHSLDDVTISIPMDDGDEVSILVSAFRPLVPVGSLDDLTISTDAASPIAESVVNIGNTRALRSETSTPGGTAITYTVLSGADVIIIRSVFDPQASAADRSVFETVTASIVLQ